MARRRKALEEQLGREILASERLRATIIAVAFTLAGPLVIGLLSLSPVHRTSHRLEMTGLQTAVAVTLTFLTAYAWILRAVLGRYLAEGRKSPRIWRFVSAVVEVSAVTTVVLVFGRITDPVFATSAPPTYLYSIFIMLSILQLDMQLSIFMGVLAAVEYTVASLVHLGSVDPAVYHTPMFTSPVPVFIKGVILMLGGGFAGFVAREIERRLVRTLETVAERDRAIEMFGQHVSPQVADKLLQHRGEFPSETRHVCVMFLDIRDFTRFSEGKRPEEVVDYLNALFGPLVAVVNRHGGIINKFLGDGFMAVFGAPFSDGRECQAAVRAALEIVAAVDGMAKAGTIPPTRLGIGLHAGEAVTGNVGAEARKEYTVIGDTVNLASRIEALTKQYDAQVLVSEAVFSEVDGNGLEASALPPVQVKGRDAPVRVYRLL
jgi:adenylate cyclase